MKTNMMKIALLLMGLIFAGQTAFAQFATDLQYYRSPDKDGLNVFESPKETNTVAFDGVRVRLGGSNTLQFQALDHENSGAAIFKIGPNFNLATSNLDLDVQLHNGVRMHLRTYLSSRHHPEPYVKGGYMQIDRLDFIQEDFLSDIMDKVTIKVGHMQNNYGDTHFRRSDNGQALFNPFVGNYIMDSFTTEVGAEVYYRTGPFMAMIGATNGKLNQSTVLAAPGRVNNKPVYLVKLGYDNQMNEDLRVRLTGSLYTTSQSAVNYLYTGDRAGSRYYNILTNNAAEFRSPRFTPGFNNEITAIMINPFVKFQGFEFFGVFETVSGKNYGGVRANADATPTRTFNQYGAELIYRFGGNENYYVGGRYNMVAGEIQSGEDVDISRINVGGGWFMTKNILAKAEYVTQSYNGFPAGNILEDGKFSGFMLEAVISF
jgi:hypothetical protein